MPSGRNFQHFPLREERQGSSPNGYDHVPTPFDVTNLFRLEFNESSKGLGAQVLEPQTGSRLFLDFELVALSASFSSTGLPDSGQVKFYYSGQVNYASVLGNIYCSCVPGGFPDTNLVCVVEGVHQY